MKAKFLEMLLSRMELRSLDDHANIGIDLDGTLISGIHHTEIEEWARQTSSNLHVITFRPSLTAAQYDFLKTIPAIQSVHHLPRDIQEFSKKYLRWKGKICRDMGITALIDDDTVAVLDGCIKYDIQYFNALKWPQYRTRLTNKS